MRFRKPVFAETENLLIDLAREFLRVSTRRHSIDQSLLEFFETALAPPCGHRATQAVGFARCKSSGNDRELHHLFLENRHAERALEDTLHGIARIGHVLEALAAF